MSSSLPLDHLRLEIAPGAVLSADPDTWPWVDVTGFIHQKDEVVYTSGERDEAQSTLPSVVTLTLDNTDGRFSPRNPLGAWFGLLSRNTPLRLFWDTDPLSEIVFVSEWPPRWDMTAIQATAPISADGITRRLEQGAQALDSPLFRSLSQHDNVIAYWPCEDGRDATQAASPLDGVNPFTPSGVTFGESTEQGDGSVLHGAGSVMRIDDPARNVLGRVPNHTPGDVYVVELAWLMPDVATSTRAVLEAYTTSADFARWQIRASSTTFQLRAWDADDSVVVNETETINDALWGQWVRAELLVSGSFTTGLSVRAGLYALDVDRTELNLISNSNVGSGALGRVVRAGVHGPGMFQTRYAGQVAVLTGTTTEFPFSLSNTLAFGVDLHSPYHGFTGELAADRFERLCDEEASTCSVAAPTGGLDVLQEGEAGQGPANATTPDAASLDITGDLDVRAWLSFAVVVGNTQHVVSKWEATDDERSWAFGVQGGQGRMALWWTTDGTTGTQSSVFADELLEHVQVTDRLLAMRTTLDVDNGSSEHVVTFYHGPSLDGPWTAFHTETLAGTTSIYSGAASLYVGGDDDDVFDTDVFGRIRGARVYDGIDDTLVASPDFAAQEIGATSFDDDQGNTWTVNGEAEIVRADDSMPMGPQQIDTLIANFRDVEATDGGRLTEHMGGFRYRTRTALYNQDDALTLDNHGLLSEPPEPTDDDQQLRNDVTAQSPFGTSVRAVDQDSVDQLGRYDTQRTVNPQTPDQLLQIANWALHLGTVDDMRWPRINLALHKDPDLIPAWLALRFGDRIRLDQTLSQLPGIEIDQLIIGAVQRFTRFTWDVELNCIPAEPYDVAVFGTSRFDTAGSETSGSFVAGTDTSLTVVTTATQPWVNSTNHASEFPFKIEVSGVKLNVTAISGATSPQTFTVDATPTNGVEKTIPSGSAVRLSSRPAFAL